MYSVIDNYNFLIFIKKLHEKRNADQREKSKQNKQDSEKKRVSG